MTFDPNRYDSMVRAQRVALGTLLTNLHDGDLIAKTQAPTDDPTCDEWLKMVLLGIPNKRLLLLNRKGPDVLAGRSSQFLNYMYEVWEGTQVLDLDEKSPLFEFLGKAAGRKYEEWPKALRSAFWNYELSIIVIYADEFEDEAELRAIMSIYTVVSI